MSLLEFIDPEVAVTQSSPVPLQPSAPAYGSYEYEVELGATRAELALGKLVERRAQNWTPISISAFGAPPEDRYAVVWRRPFSSLPGRIVDKPQWDAIFGTSAQDAEWLVTLFACSPHSIPSRTWKSTSSAWTRAM